jgi:hypothetical protein
MYCNDFNDSMPAPGWGTSTYNWITAPNPPNMYNHTLAGFQSDYDHQVSWFIGTTAQEPGSPTPPGCGQLYPYLKNAKLFLCPQDVVNQLYLERPETISSYVWNGAPVGYGSVTSPCKISKFKPTNILQWENDEKQTAAGFWGDFSNKPSENGTTPSLSQRHGKTGQIGRMDGSAARELWINLVAWCVENSKPNDMWCSPYESTGH